MDKSLDLGAALKAPSLLDENLPNGAEADDDPTLNYNAKQPAKLAQTASSVQQEGDMEALDSEAALRQERDALRAINGSLESNFDRLSSAKDKIATTHNLMNLYTRLLSQASHTQQLLLDGEWSLAADAARAQEEEAAERRRQEEEERAAQQEQARLEEEQRQREARAAAATSTVGTRGARGMARGRGATLGPRGRPPSSSVPAADPSSSRTLGRGTIPVSGVRGQRGLRSRGARGV